MWICEYTVKKRRKPFSYSFPYCLYHFYVQGSMIRAREIMFRKESMPLWDLQSCSDYFLVKQMWNIQDYFVLFKIWEAYTHHNKEICDKKSNKLFSNYLLK